MGCSSSLPLRAIEHQSLLGRCWEAQHHVEPNTASTSKNNGPLLLTIPQKITSHWFPYRDNDDGERPHSAFSLDPEFTQRTHTTVGSPITATAAGAGQEHQHHLQRVPETGFLEKHALMVHFGVDCQEVNETASHSLSSDTILTSSETGIGGNVDVQGTMISLGAEYSRVKSAGPGRRSLYTIHIVKCFELKMIPSEWSERRYVRRQVDNNISNPKNREQFGEGIITKVLYGGYLVVEAEQENFSEMQKGIGVRASVSGSAAGGGGVSGHFAKSKTEGSKSTNFRIRRVGGDAKLIPSNLTNVTNEKLMDYVDKWETDLRKFPRKAQPISMYLQTYNGIATHLLLPKRTVIDQAQEEIDAANAIARCEILGDCRARDRLFGGKKKGGGETAAEAGTSASPGSLTTATSSSSTTTAGTATPAATLLPPPPPAHVAPYNRFVDPTLLHIQLQQQRELEDLNSKSPILRRTPSEVMTVMPSTPQSTTTTGTELPSPRQNPHSLRITHHSGASSTAAHQAAQLQQPSSSSYASPMLVVDPSTNDLVGMMSGSSILVTSSDDVTTALLVGASPKLPPPASPSSSLSPRTAAATTTSRKLSPRRSHDNDETDGGMLRNDSLFGALFPKGGGSSGDTPRTTTTTAAAKNSALASPSDSAKDSVAVEVSQVQHMMHRSRSTSIVDLDRDYQHQPTTTSSFDLKETQKDVDLHHPTPTTTTASHIPHAVSVERLVDQEAQWELAQRELTALKREVEEVQAGRLAVQDACEALENQIRCLRRVYFRSVGQTELAPTLDLFEALLTAPHDAPDTEKEFAKDWLTSTALLLTHPDCKLDRVALRGDLDDADAALFAGIVRAASHVIPAHCHILNLCGNEIQMEGACAVLSAVNEVMTLAPPAASSSLTSTMNASGTVYSDSVQQGSPLLLQKTVAAASASQTASSCATIVGKTENNGGAATVAAPRQPLGGRSAEGRYANDAQSAVELELYLHQNEVDHPHSVCLAKELEIAKKNPRLLVRI